MQNISRVLCFFVVSAGVLASAQSVNNMGGTVTTGPGAPIVRQAPGGYANGRPLPMAQVFNSQPNAGIYVRSDMSSGVQVVTSSALSTELRIIQGRADVTVRHPADHSAISVDLPGGQVTLLKDGLYTFNASTNTVRVLEGEAEAYLGPQDTSKGVKVKETQELAFSAGGKLRAIDVYPAELTADLLPGAGRSHGDGGYGNGFEPGYYGGYPFYAGGFGYPGYGFEPYGYGLGYGYPFGFGLGFGYYGGFGGYRGGFRR